MMLEKSCVEIDNYIRITQTDIEEKYEKLQSG
jgi:hypothetical protein